MGPEIRFTRLAMTVMNTAENRLLVAALGYAKHGWKVLPCAPHSKQPATRHGFKDATSEKAQLVAWWSRRPNANVAIVTGKVSGIVVLDVDPRNGGNESLTRVEE